MLNKNIIAPNPSKNTTIRISASFNEIPKLESPFTKLVELVSLVLLVLLELFWLFTPFPLLILSDSLEVWLESPWLFELDPPLSEFLEESWELELPVFFEEEPVCFEGFEEEPCEDPEPPELLFWVSSVVTSV